MGGGGVTGTEVLKKLFSGMGTENLQRKLILIGTKEQSKSVYLWQVNKPSQTVRANIA